ncbi:hypothetical protein [Streptomyces sp. NBC_00827]|uniref:hypothetical protein n=1 Tax=Streptomyces sp. NBC_00827 TaxID=2903677 RepID=UPI003866D90D|nr:hypothetical protein OG569_37995 [Streptomyces sp. NBC_00827]
MARLARIRKSNGTDAILWGRTRSKMGITANSQKAGHGRPLDLGFIDKACAHEDDRLEQAFNPAMLTWQMAQVWWASAGGTNKSAWLNKKRAIGRELIQAFWTALLEIGSSCITGGAIVAAWPVPVCSAAVHPLPTNMSIPDGWHRGSRSPAHRARDHGLLLRSGQSASPLGPRVHSTGQSRV